MRKLMRDPVISPGFSGAMTTHSTPMAHFEQDLFDRSVGSPGRALLKFLDQRGLNPPGAPRLSELALWLQTPGYTSDATLVGINYLARERQGLVSVVVVALKPLIQSRLERAARHQGASSLLSDFSTGVMETVGEWAKLPIIWERQAFVNQIFSATRRAGRGDSPNKSIDPLVPGRDYEKPALDASANDARWNALGMALVLRKIDWTDFVLAELTHSGETTLTEVAKVLGVPYDTLNKRRQRTEDRIREFIESQRVA